MRRVGRPRENVESKHRRATVFVLKWTQRPREEKREKMKKNQKSRRKRKQKKNRKKRSHGYSVSLLITDRDQIRDAYVPRWRWPKDSFAATQRDPWSASLSCASSTKQADERQVISYLSSEYRKRTYPVAVSCEQVLFRNVGTAVNRVHLVFTLCGQSIVHSVKLDVVEGVNFE